MSAPPSTGTAWLMARRRRKKEGFHFWGPFPAYSRRTRRGTRVRVTGCCLPLALGLATGSSAVVAAGARALLR